MRTIFAMLSMVAAPLQGQGPTLAAVRLIGSISVHSAMGQDSATTCRRDGSRPIPARVTASREFQRALASGTRSDDGTPGPRYWQQWTDYRIRVRLDVKTRRLHGVANLRYHNRSPDTLSVLYIQLLQNVHRAGAVRNSFVDDVGGVELTRIRVGGQAMAVATDGGPGFRVVGTSLEIRPPNPLRPTQSVDLEIEWTFVVPKTGAGPDPGDARMGWDADNLFFIAYWYPQMAVYDDVVGWQTDQYRGIAEFYAGFGSYDVRIDAPEGWIVSATGVLRNEGEVLSPSVVRRLRQAEGSDEVVPVFDAGGSSHGVATRKGVNGRLIWHFQADTARDFTFSASRGIRWDAVRSPVGDRDGDGRPDYTRIDALYRLPAVRWANMARYARQSIAFHSAVSRFPYPWSHLTAVEGPMRIGGGMEFPMMTLIGDFTQAGDTGLYYTTAHELGHMWLPMIVSTDERRYGWMDEGTTRFNDVQAGKAFYPATYRTEDRARQAYLRIAGQEIEGPIMRWTDFHYGVQSWEIASYEKPASVLVALRGLIGEELFLTGYRDFIHRWAFKHPKPWDFFNTFNRVAGRNLDWFWRSWYYETWTLDQAVGAVTRDSTGTTVMVEDCGLIPMPARLTITLQNGGRLYREVPVDRWLSGAWRVPVVVPGGEPVVRVEIDAERVFPDVDRANNVWTAGGAR